MAKQKASIDRLKDSTSKVAIEDFIELLNSPKRLAWLNFYSGLMKGVGGVLGAAVVLVLLGFAVRYLGGVPWFGDLIHKVGEAAKMK